MKRALGIEVGRAFVALCEVTFGPDDSARGQRFARHVFNETENPSPEEVADACLKAASELGIRERAVVLALARDLTFVKPVQLPPVALEDRLRLLSLQPERFFPVSDRPLVCDLELGSNGRLPVAHAAEAERLEALVDALQSRGFRVTAVLPSPAAELRAAVRSVPKLAAARWLLVRQEGDGLTANAYEAGVLRASRRVEHFGADPLRACREIWRTARQGIGEGLTVEEVRWSGWRELPREIKQLAEATVEVPVRDLSEVPVASEGLVAYGAALARLEETPRPDLLPPVVRARRRQQSRWMTMACAALVVLGGMALLWALGQRQRDHLTRLDAAVASARAGAQESDEARAELEAVEDRIQSIQRRMDERAAWLRLLNEISAALPERAWIASLAIEPTGQVNLSGYAATASALIPALEATRTLVGVELAAPATRTTVESRELEAFNIRGVLQGSPADSVRSADRDSLTARTAER